MHFAKRFSRTIARFNFKHYLNEDREKFSRFVAVDFKFSLRKGDKVSAPRTFCWSWLVSCCTAVSRRDTMFATLKSGEKMTVRYMYVSLVDSQMIIQEALSSTRSSSQFITL